MSEEGALSGIRVLDLTRVLAGPLCTMWLGDLGADVVKVELPGRGDDTRGWGPPFVGTESAYFLGVNRNKRSITLNLKSDEGRALLRRLASTADAVVDNFKQGTLERFGLDDAWYEANAPRAIRCTISGYGSSGPEAGKLGYDFIAQAETGLLAITGEPDGEPMKFGVPIVDICTGMLATVSVLAALSARRRTGRGQRLEATLHDTGLQMLANVAANHLASGEPAGRYGTGHPNIVPYRTYSVADGSLALAVGNDSQFARFASLVGHPEWASDPRFAHNRDRVVARNLIDGLIGDVMVKKPRKEWIELLAPAGIPCGPIRSVAEALTSAQAKAREMVTLVEHPRLGAVPLLGVPFSLSATPASVRRPPPLVGEHTDEILVGMLGLGTDEIDALRQAGVI